MDEELAFALWQAFESLGLKSTDDPPAPPPLTGEYLARRLRAVFDDLDMRQLAIARRLSPARRLRQVLELNRLARRLVAASIRSQHPDISPVELNRRIAERMGNRL